MNNKYISNSGFCFWVYINLGEIPHRNIRAYAQEYNFSTVFSQRTEMPSAEKFKWTIVHGQVGYRVLARLNELYLQGEHSRVVIYKGKTECDLKLNNIYLNFKHELACIIQFIKHELQITGKCVLSLVLSCHSKDLKQQTSFTTRLQLRVSFSKQRKICLRGVRVDRPQRRDSILALLSVYFVSSPWACPV